MLFVILNLHITEPLNVRMSEWILMQSSSKIILTFLHILRRKMKGINIMQLSGYFVPLDYSGLRMTWGFVK